MGKQDIERQERQIPYVMHLPGEDFDYFRTAHKVWGEKQEEQTSIFAITGIPTGQGSIDWTVAYTGTTEENTTRWEQLVAMTLYALSLKTEFSPLRVSYRSGAEGLGRRIKNHFSDMEKRPRRC